MTHICPVCKARLWRGPFARRLRCPRCGAEFRPTVSLFYFQILFVLFLVVCLAVVVVLSRNHPWYSATLGLILILVAALLPRLVRLEPDSQPLPLAEGLGPDDLQKLRFGGWGAASEPSLRPGWLVTLLIVLGAVILGWLILHFTY